MAQVKLFINRNRVTDDVEKQKTLKLPSNCNRGIVVLNEKPYLGYNSINQLDLSPSENRFQGKNKTSTI